MRDFLKIDPWSKQVEIANALFTHHKVVVRSGNGVGKSWISAALTLTFLANFWPSKVVVTAPTFKQVKEIIWEEINDMYRSSLMPQFIGGEMLTMSYKIKDNHYAVGFTTRENRVEDFQGYHSENILVIFEESPGISEIIYQAAQGLMTTNAYFLQIGNPTSKMGHFWKAFSDDSYHKVHISCFDSPNITGERNIPALVNMRWIEDRKKEWGEDSVLYKSRVEGEFVEERGETGIPMQWVLDSFGGDS